jgi:hypothetical protein
MDKFNDCVVICICTFEETASMIVKKRNETFKENHNWYQKVEEVTA